MRRALRAAVVLLTCALAHAQAPAPAPNPNMQAKELAQRLGREQSLEGLETIVAARNVDLFAAYERGWREVSAGKRPQPLPPAIEALIIRNYQDPVMGPALRTLCSANWTPYQTRELFDLMFAEWRSGKVRRSTYDIRDAVLKTSLAGIEAPLLEWLQARDPPTMEDFKQIIGFLGRRHYEPAIPLLVSLQSKPDRSVAYAASIALLDIGTPVAVDAVLEQLAASKAAPAAGDEKSNGAYLLQRIAQLPPSLPLPYQRLRKALPDDNRAYATTWLTQRKDLAAVPDALVLLGDSRTYPGALDALIATDSPEIWKRARTEVERHKGEGRLNDGQYAYASRTLDEKIANPEKHFAEQRQVERNKEFNAKSQALGAQRMAADKLRESSPDAYIKASREYLAAAERLVEEYRDLPPAAVGLKGEVGSKYLELGHLARFKLKQTARALELYEAGRRSGNGLATLAIADTYQFNLGDRAQALQRYRAMLDDKQPGRQTYNDTEASIGQFAQSWLSHQVDFLEKGATFSGPVRMESCGAATLFVAYGGGGGGGEGDYFDLAAIQRLFVPQTNPAGARLSDADRKTLAKALGALPASTFVLMRTAPFIAQLPDADAILAYLGKQDPAGFASACYFAAMGTIEPEGASGPLRAAAARFNRQHRIVAAQADPRMATPEGTWRLLMDSLRKGDSATAMSCLTPGQQNKFRILFEGQPREKMRTMAEAFTGFALTQKYGEDMQEAFVTRGKQGGYVHFIKSGGVWKINEM